MIAACSQLNWPQFEPVTLQPYEIQMAAAVGVRRQIEALARGLPDHHGARHDSGWQYHIEGACGELALAKFLNLYWDGSVNTFRRPDLGSCIQVRTRTRHDYDLIIRDGDDLRHLFVLVTGSCPHYAIRGYLPGQSVLGRSDWRQSYGGREVAWFVPAAALRPVPRSAGT
ncbi:hypothetical protein [Fontivita pretiosa]|uniref:hypothetical protein n=1 Tax=Fontivita pretiosa TaxID=2989684 RepID=UPI002D116CDD|nr:hypothetical protein [Tepidisphaeraceae bacterium]